MAMMWARLFLREADRELNGLPHQMQRAAAQTICAIEQIDPPADFTGKKCEHGDFFRHNKTGACVHPDCAPQHDPFGGQFGGQCGDGCPCLLTKE